MKLYRPQRLREDRGGPKVYLLPKCRFRLSPEAMRLLGDPEAVQIFVDLEDKRIAFRGSEREAPGAKPVWRLKAHQSGYVSAAKFFRRFGLEQERVAEYPAALEEDFLVICVKNLLSESAKDQDRQTTDSPHTQPQDTRSYDP